MQNCIKLLEGNVIIKLGIFLHLVAVCMPYKLKACNILVE